MDISISICDVVKVLHLECVIRSYLLQPPGMQDGTPSCNADSLIMMIPDSAAFLL